MSGRRPGQFLREEVCEPLGAEAYIGVPEEISPRVAEVVFDGTGPLALLLGDPSMFRRAEVPASGGFTNARSLARIYAALASGGQLDGVRLLGKDVIEDAISSSVTGPWFNGDQLPPIVASSRFARGWILNSAIAPMGPNPRSFGYAGSGGSIAWADPDARISFAYTPDLFASDFERQPERAGQLADVLYGCL